jgi:hypothetical protein
MRVVRCTDIHGVQVDKLIHALNTQVVCGALNGEIARVFSGITSPAKHKKDEGATVLSRLPGNELRKRKNQWKVASPFAAVCRVDIVSCIVILSNLKTSTFNPK